MFPPNETEPVVDAPTSPPGTPAKLFVDGKAEFDAFCAGAFANAVAGERDSCIFCGGVAKSDDPPPALVDARNPLTADD